MATTAGSLSAVSVGATASVIQSGPGTGGTAPYTYQLYRSTATGFSPGSVTLIAGATTLTTNDSGLTPGTIYYYKMVTTDSTGTPVTATSSQLSVTTQAASPSPNQFAMSPYLGQLDQYYNGDTIPCQFDPAGTGTLTSGMAVKFSATAGGVPKVVPCTAAADEACGFVNYNMKLASYGPGDLVEISSFGNVMYLYAALAISRGQRLTSLPSGIAGGCNGGVVPVTGSSGFPIVGYSLDTATIGNLTRVFIYGPLPFLD